MAWRHRVKKADKGIQTFLGPEAVVEGKLVFDGTLRLDGRYSGRIESKGGLMVVGENAVVKADIFVHTADVSGQVTGNITATDRIELHPPARVVGDLNAPVVVIGAGVAFQGNCTAQRTDDGSGNTIVLRSPIETARPVDG